MKTMIQILSLSLLLTSCFGPGIFKDKDGIGGTGIRSTFNATPSFFPTTDSYNPMPSTIQVTFPSNVNMQTVSNADITLTATGGCQGNNLLTSWSVLGQTLSLLLNTAGCVSGDTITLMVDLLGVFDDQGNQGTGTFSQTYVLDISNAPSPILNLNTQTVSSLPSSFTFVVDSSINQSSITSNVIQISGTGSCPSNPYQGMSISGNTVTVNMDVSTCANGDEVTVSLLSYELRDNDGNSGVGTITRTLTLDTVGPDASQITSDLADGNYNPLPTSITLTIPSDIDMNQIQLSNFIAVGSGSCPANALTGMQKISNHIVLSFDTNGCADGDKIDFSINMSQIRDLAGNPGTGSFTRELTLVSSIPAAPSFSVNSGIYSTLPASVVASFGAQINMSTVNLSSITASGTGACSPTPFVSVVNNGQDATISLNTAGCQSGDEITLSVDMGQIQNNLGVSGNGIIRKTYVLDNIGPSAPIISVNTGSVSSFPSSIVLTFGSDTDMNTVDLNSIAVIGSGSCPASAISSISISGNVATVNLNSAGCASGDTLSLNVDLTKVKDMTGNAGVGSVSRVLTLDTSTPAAPSVSPASGVYQSLPSVLTFTFSNVNMSTVDLSDFTYQANGSCASSGIVSYSKSSSSFVLNIDTSSCGNGDTVIVTLNMAGIENNVGTAGSGSPSFTYTRDIAGPDSASYSPAGGVAQTLPSSISITLPADTNMSTVTLADFALNILSGCPSASITGISKSGTVATLSIDTSSCTSGGSFSVVTNFSGINDNIGNAGVGSANATYTLDTTGPASASISPASATLSALPTSVAVTFSNDTDMSSVSQADFSFSGNGGCPANPFSSISYSGQVATVNLNTSGCLLGNSISVGINMSGVTDALGNAGAGVVQNTYTLDNQGLVAGDISVSPATGTYQVLPTSVAFTFPVGTDMSTVDASDFTAVGAAGCQANSLGSVSKSGNIANVSLNSAGCADNSTITLTLNLAGIKDTAGNDGVGSIQQVYTLDNNGPAAAIISPATQDFINMPSSATITFSNDTNMSSVSAADFTAVGSGSCPSNASAGFTISGQVLTLNLNSAACTNGGKITITVNMAGVTDGSGNPGTGSPSVVYTKDTVGPASASVSVNSGDFAVLPTSLAYTFAADTVMSSITASSFTAIGTGSCQANAFSSISKVGQVATVNLNTSGCVSGNTITVNLNMATALDAAGNTGVGIVSRVLTLDNQGPALATVAASGYVNVMPSAVPFTFPLDVDMSSVTAADFTAVGTGSCPVNALSSISKVGQVATVNLNTAGCANNSTITISLNMSGVTDAVGNVGTGTVSRVLTLDTVAPTLLSVSSAGGTVQNMPTSISYTLSSDVDMSTVTLADFTAVGALGCPTNAASSVSISGQVATLNLNTAGCVNNSTLAITLNMAGVSDFAGNAGSGLTSRSFVRDTVGPNAPSITMVGGNLLQIPNQVIFSFESDVNMATVDLSDITVNYLLALCASNPVVSLVKSGQTATLNLNQSACLNIAVVGATINMTTIQDNVGNSGTNSAFAFQIKVP